MLNNETRAATFNELIILLMDLEVEPDGTIPQKNINTLERIAHDSQVLTIKINEMIAGMALALNYAQEEGKANGCFWILHKLANHITYLNELRFIAHAALETGQWVQIGNTDNISIPWALIGIPYIPKSIGVNTVINKQALEKTYRSSDDFFDDQQYDLKVYSEAFEAALATCEINKGLAGSLSYISEWTNLIGALAFTRAKAYASLKVGSIQANA